MTRRREAFSARASPLLTVAKIPGESQYLFSGKIYRDLRIRAKELIKSICKHAQMFILTET